MPNIALEIIAVFLLLVVNGIFSMSEIAVVTARKSRLHNLAEQGLTRAKQALDLANHPNRFLSTVQIGITLVGILAGAFGGGTLTEWLAIQLAGIPLLADYARTMALTIVVICITYFSVIIGELVPKRLALSHPELIAMFMAPLMRLLLMICGPIVHLFSVSIDSVFRLFGKRFDQESLVTEEEITTLLRQGAQAGVFEETEKEMVEAVFDLGDISARGLMTPRTQIVWLDVNDPIERLREKLAGSSHSRFPLCDGALDNVLGIVQTKDLLAAFLLSDKFDLRATMQPADFIPRTMTALQVLDHIKNSGSHIVLVVDEYGGIEGLLTHHDLLEAIAGEMTPHTNRPLTIKSNQDKPSIS